MDKPLPLEPSEDVSDLCKKKMSKSALVRIAYSPQGSKLAVASQDTLITVLKTPVYKNQIELSTLQGHN